MFFRFLLKLKNKYWNTYLCGAYRNSPGEGANEILFILTFYFIMY